AADDCAAFGNCRQRCRHKASDGCEDDRCVEFGWGLLGGIAGPDRAEALGKSLRRFVAGPDKSKDLAALPSGDLGHDMCCCAKAVDPEPRRVTCHPEAAIAD